eukprot:jgi/Mesen1/3459/ME000194S02610
MRSRRRAGSCRVSSAKGVRAGLETDESGNAGGNDEEVLIVGGGVAGLATALALHKVGIRAKVLEQATALKGGAALSLWGNAWRALDVIGVGPQLRSLYSPLT